jgi:uncharacterized protein YciI
LPKRSEFTVPRVSGQRFYAVIREPGPAWDRSRPMREQAGWEAHAAFMDELAADGFVVLGGPLGDNGRALHVIDAESEREIEDRLAGDPWTETGLLVTVSVDQWTILLESTEQRDKAK